MRRAEELLCGCIWQYAHQAACTTSAPSFPHDDIRFGARRLAKRQICSRAHGPARCRAAGRRLAGWEVPYAHRTHRNVVIAGRRAYRPWKLEDASGHVSGVSCVPAMPTARWTALRGKSLGQGQRETCGVVVQCLSTLRPRAHSIVRLSSPAELLRSITSPCDVG